MKTVYFLSKINGKQVKLEVRVHEDGRQKSRGVGETSVGFPS